MGSKNDKNYVSVGSWMLMMFLLGVPVLNLIMILLLAVVGENESRKNYFRAIIGWFLIVLALCLAIILAGYWPEIHRRIQSWIHKL